MSSVLWRELRAAAKLLMKLKLEAVWRSESECDAIELMEYQTKRMALFQGVMYKRT